MASKPKGPSGSLFEPLPLHGSLADPGRARRANKPKVRTGCLTCKRRHLKCDERRPRCVRCENGRFECLGYPESVVRVSKTCSQPPTSGRRILPREFANPTVPLAVNLLASPVDGPYKGVDATYFDLFRRQLVRDLAGSGMSFSAFWDRTVLRESFDSPLVRNGLLAISALSHGLYFGPDAVPPSMTGIPALCLLPAAHGVRNEHHLAALHFHSRTVAMLRASTAQLWRQGDVTSSRAILIVTLLLVTYELLQGNVGTADGLASSGVTLLKTRLDANEVVVDPSLQDADEGLEEAVLLFLRMSMSITLSPFSGSKARGRSTVALRVDSARRRPPPGPGFEGVKRPWLNFIGEALSWVGRHYWSRVAGDPVTDEGEARAQQADFLRNIAGYEELMTNLARANEAAVLTQDGLPDPATSERLRRIQLGLLHVGLFKVLIYGCLDRTGLAYDDLRPVFFDMLTRVEILVDRYPCQSRVHFTSNQCVIPPISAVASLCRDYNIRMRALNLYRRLSRREGVWDPHAHLIGESALIRMESAGADATGFVPPESRWIWSSGSWDTSREKLLAEYTRAVPDDNGEPVVVKMELDYVTQLGTEPLAPSDQQVEGREDGQIFIDWELGDLVS